MKQFHMLSAALLLAAFTAHAQPGYELIKDPAFKKAFTAVLGTHKSVKWFSQLSGPSSPSTKVKLGATEYTAVDVCKPHSCSDENAIIFYSPELGKAYARLNRNGKFSTLGSPPADVSQALEAAHAERFKAAR